jgi:hypothetical protein
MPGALGRRQEAQFSYPIYSVFFHLFLYVAVFQVSYISSRLLALCLNRTLHRQNPRGEGL